MEHLTAIKMENRAHSAQRTAHSAQRTAHRRTGGWWSVFALTIAVILGMATERAAVAQCSPPSASTRYVKEGGSDSLSGQCWDEAYATLEKALADLNAEESQVTLIKIAGGTYWPSGTNGSFVIERAVTIEGGYAGTGTNPDARDFDLYETILSGDIGETDDDDPPVFTDNSFTVVTISIPWPGGTMALDGLTIERGDASPSLSGLAGGVSVTGPLEDGEFNAVNCVFRLHRATFGGAAINIEGVPARLRRCRFEGGELVPSTYQGQQFQPPNPGGAAVRATGALEVVRCSFIGNQATERAFRGGAIVAFGSTLRVVNSTFIENEAGRTSAEALEAGRGGAIWTESAEVTLTGCLMARNRVFGVTRANGGAVHAGVEQVVTIENCTIVENESDLRCGGVYSASSPSVRNSILFFNTGSTGSVLDRQVLTTTSIEDPPPPLDIEFSCVEGIDPAEYPGAGVINDDPLLLDPSTSRYTLRYDSPAIDTGDEALLPADVTDVNDADGDTEPLPWDLATESRVRGCELDMGAYESKPCPIDLSGNGAVDGADLTLVLGHWGACPLCPEDLNGDGVVNGAELALVTGNWGECPGCGESSMMMSEGGSSSLTPALLASLFGFESVEAFSLWLSQQEFETMSSILNLLIGE